MDKKSAILLATDKNSPVILNLYKTLKKVAGEWADVFVLLHRKVDLAPDPIIESAYFRFDNSVLTELEFVPIGKRLVPGNNHFPLFKFYREYPDYQYYWVIEDDVRFSGNWSAFFRAFMEVSDDFISSNVRKWNEEPLWSWWNLNHPREQINLSERIASFNPIYRLSNEATAFLYKSLLDHWSGHHEVLIPSLLINNGFNIADFGGNGVFVKHGFENRFYESGSPSKNGMNLEGTMRWRPVFPHVGNKPDKLYHPVKDFGSNPENYNTTSIKRKEWLYYMDKIASPVIKNLAADTLRENMSVFLSGSIDNPEYRREVSYLEAFARTISGIAPWLNIEGGSREERALRDEYRSLTLKAISNAVDPKARDYMKWTGGQPLVDASYFALALIRCPWLWENLDNEVCERIATSLRSTRSTIPVYTNWILFSGMIEVFFWRFGLNFDPLRIEYCLREFMEHWYVGDGLFSDGMQFHFDYYNSIVIHPFMANILDIVKCKTNMYNKYAEKLDLLNKRYAEIQERMVHTDGTFPVMGRSMTYRGGVFHHLADISLRKQLPDSLKPAQVREALSAVISRTLKSPKTFDEDGWLNIGLYGDQPKLANFYITTGSLYMCANIFLPLGLPNSDEFWHLPFEPWTAVKAWKGEDLLSDSALDV